jgi:hypothetical protein
VSTATIKQGDIAGTSGGSIVNAGQFYFMPGGSLNWIGGTSLYFANSGRMFKNGYRSSSCCSFFLPSTWFSSTTTTTTTTSGPTPT